MSGSKHTPAHTGRQWSAKSYGYEKYAILDDRGTEVGFAHRRRDAHLIAAAPDLLEALKAVRCFVDVPDEAADDEADRVGDLVNAAIAKAEGRG